MNAVWHKMWRDLTLKSNRARTILAVLSTAVGVFALGLVFGMSGAMRAELTAAHRAALPAHITLWGGPFSPDIVDAIWGEPGVVDVEGERVVSFRWKRLQEEDWRDAEVIARADYAAQRMNLARLLDGRWPAKRALAVERLSSEQFDLSPGTEILVEVGQRERRLPVEGVAQAYAVLSPEWGGEVTFLATPETAAWLTGYAHGEDFDRLLVRMEAYDEERATALAQRIEERLERIGLAANGYEITDPDVHWMQDMLDAVLVVLTAMGVLSLALSAFLIVNTVNALVAQQVWQIGVMKAVGATLHRVARIYLVTAATYGALALLLAVPSGVVGAHGVTIWLLDKFNVRTDTFQFDPAAVGIQVIVGLAVPVLAALVPALGGARAPVRQAIASRGLGSGFGQSWLDHAIGQVRGLPRLVALGLRNTFRRKARAALTLIALTLGGVMYAMVLSADRSFDGTVRTMFDVGGEVTLSLEHPQRASRLTEIAEAVPGVDGVEVWDSRGAILSLAAGPGRPRGHVQEIPVRLHGVPSGSAMFAPPIVRGRSLLAGDEYAVLINGRVAREREIRVGDTITLLLDKQESAWTVVGTYLSADSLSDNFYVPLDALARETHTTGRGRGVMVRSERDDVASQRRLIGALTDALDVQHIEVSRSWSASAQWQESQASFGVLIYLLLAMAVLVATVGGIGLASTMSINVVERRREIGVMRAIGASSWAIAGMFVVEGVFVGALSWLLAVPLSIPSARLFSDLIGEAVIKLPLEFAYATGGMLLWLGIVAALSALASLWPALKATQISVREALAYE